MFVYDPYALGLTVSRINGVEALVVCPFHDDHKPSASFNVERGLFICFTCGERGSAAKIAKKLGTDIERVELSTIAVIDTSKDRETWEWVLHCPLARHNEYLIGRGVTEKDVVEYDIREYEHGIAFIFKNEFGVPIGAQLRLSDDDAPIRYMTLGGKPPLWPFDKFRQNIYSSSIILVEGNFGAINARRYGVNAYSVIGVGSAFNSSKLATGFRTRIAVFDDDRAGHRASLELMVNRKFWAFAPGTEADEEDDSFWRLLLTKCVISPTEFAETADCFDILENVWEKRNSYMKRKVW